MPDRTLVTGFLAFGGFDVNPSALLAQSCGRRFELLEVSFAAVDAFLERVSADSSFDRLVMLGLNARGTTIRLERTARNHVGDTPDVRGVVRGPAPVESLGPDTLPSTLFATVPHAGPFAASEDAGCYLCNYIYYRALRRLAHQRVGFVHVPPTEVLPLEVQRQQLATLLGAIEGADPSGAAAAATA